MKFVKNRLRTSLGDDLFALSMISHINPDWLTCVKDEDVIEVVMTTSMCANDRQNCMDILKANYVVKIIK